MNEQKRADILDTIAFLRERSWWSLNKAKCFNSCDLLSKIHKYHYEQEAITMLKCSNTLIALYEERVKLDEA